GVLVLALGEGREGCLRPVFELRHGHEVVVPALGLLGLARGSVALRRFPRCLIAGRRSPVTLGDLVEAAAPAAGVSKVARRLKVGGPLSLLGGSLCGAFVEIG